MMAPNGCAMIKIREIQCKFYSNRVNPHLITIKQTLKVSFPVLLHVHIDLVNNSSFTNNQAGTDGGVMYVGSGNSQMIISDGSFDFNNASNRGGVISMNRSRLDISDTTIFNSNSADVGDDIIACNCDIAATFKLHNYTDLNFPDCILYGYERNQATTTATKPTHIQRYVVAIAVAIPVVFIILLILPTLFVYMFLHQWCSLKQYGIRRNR